jgi:hypothetical protein
MIYLPFFIRSRLIDSIDIAETLCKESPDTAAIATVFNIHYKGPLTMGMVNVSLQNLYREDLFYADKMFTAWTTNLDGPGKETMELFSDRFRRLYPGYMLDSKMRIRAKPETPVLNIDDLLYVLRSKDAKLWRESAWMFENCDKYLDGKPNKSNKIALASFPRSGNTFLRKYTELLTGVQSGADNTLHCNVAIQMQKMKGEDIVDDTCWIIKTHSPWCMMYAPEFKCQKILCIVRNPLDVILSWLNLVSTMSHAIKVPFDYAVEYPNWWQKWVEKLVKEVKQWYGTLMYHARKRDVPTIFVRFEDLLMNPKPELDLMMRFFTGLPQLKGTNAERRISEVIAMGKNAT